MVYPVGVGVFGVFEPEREDDGGAVRMSMVKGGVDVVKKAVPGRGEIVRRGGEKGTNRMSKAFLAACVTLGQM